MNKLELAKIQYPIGTKVVIIKDNREFNTPQIEGKIGVIIDFEETLQSHVTPVIKINDVTIRGYECYWALKSIIYSNAMRENDCLPPYVAITSTMPIDMPIIRSSNGEFFLQDGDPIYYSKDGVPSKFMQTDEILSNLNLEDSINAT